MLNMETVEMISVVFLMLLRFGLPILLLVLLAFVAQRVQTLQP